MEKRYMCTAWFAYLQSSLAIAADHTQDELAMLPDRKIKIQVAGKMDVKKQRSDN